MSNAPPARRCSVGWRALVMASEKPEVTMAMHSEPMVVGTL